MSFKFHEFLRHKVENFTTFFKTFLYYYLGGENGVVLATNLEPGVGSRFGNLSVVPTAPNPRFLRPS